MDADKPAKVKFPLWPFLNQPLFHPSFRVIWNPMNFRRAYEARLLERCLYKDSARNSDSRRRR
jgi:hypothetical protein